MSRNIIPQVMQSQYYEIMKLEKELEELKSAASPTKAKLRTATLISVSAILIVSALLIGCLTFASWHFSALIAAPVVVSIVGLITLHRMKVMIWNRHHRHCRDAKHKLGELVSNWLKDFRLILRSAEPKFDNVRFENVESLSETQMIFKMPAVLSPRAVPKRVGAIKLFTHNGELWAINHDGNLFAHDYESGSEAVTALNSDDGSRIVLTAKSRAILDHT